MKKFLDTVDASARLLDSESRSGSSGFLSEQSGLYQSHPNTPSSAPTVSSSANGDSGHGGSTSVDRDGSGGGGGGGVKEKNGGKKFKIGKKWKSDERDAKVHHIREPADDRARILCSIGCCGQGRIDITWMSRHGPKGIRSESSVPQNMAQPTETSDLVNSSSSQLMQYTSDHPVTSDDPETTGPGEKLGRLQFSIAYDFQESTLTLRIIRAIDLVAKDFSGTSDPYVKIMLLPDKKRKLTTNVKRKNLNPRWNEVFAFEGFSYNKLLTRTLYLQVLDYDRFSRDDPIGEICIPMTDIDLARGQTLWKNLQISKGQAGRLGEVNIGLCYQPTTGQLTVVVHEARQLKAKDINGLSDPYVKIWLLFDGKKVEKKKTATKEKCLNPVFEESFVFTVPYEKIRQTSISVSVMDYDRMGRNEQIGQVVLGAKSGSMEVKHWNEMFAKTRQEATQWHILKDIG